MSCTAANVCVFCGSRPGNDPRFAQAAVRLGELLAGNGLRLIYGGGGIGLMGLVTGTVMERGGRVTGVIPRFLMTPEVGNPAITELVVVSTMHERKQRMFELADAIVALPGGIGTLDEVVEVATWKQLELHRKPILLVDVGGFWDPFRDMLRNAVACGFATPALLDFVRIVATPEAAVAAILQGDGSIRPAAAAPVQADRHRADASESASPGAESAL